MTVAIDFPTDFDGELKRGETVTRNTVVVSFPLCVIGVSLSMQLLAHQTCHILDEAIHRGSAS